MNHSIFFSRLFRAEIESIIFMKHTKSEAAPEEPGKDLENTILPLDRSELFLRSWAAFVSHVRNYLECRRMSVKFKLGQSQPPAHSYWSNRICLLTDDCWLTDNSDVHGDGDDDDPL